MCKSRTLDYLISGVVLLLLVIITWWSRGYFTQLIDNLKDARTKVANVKVETPSDQVKDIGNKNVYDDSITICKAYEALDRELTSWLTVLCFAGGMFGLLVPLIGYLLQHHNLNEEHKHLREDFRTLVDLYESHVSARQDEMKQRLEDVKLEIDKIKEHIDEKANHVDERFRRYESQTLRFEEFPLAVRIRQVILSQRAGTTSDFVDVANIVIGFDYLLESLVHWEESVVNIRAKVHEWIENMKTMWRVLPNELREKVRALLSKSFKPSREFASRDDFLKILHADSDDFKWLEEFFKPFAPWKFSKSF